MLIHAFFRGLLYHYEVVLQHLNPNRIQHIFDFIALCEGYLGVPPIFDLWRYFFSVSIFRPKIGGISTSVPAGCTSIHLRNGGDHRQREYIEMGKLKTSNKGWHASWFYLKNDESAPVPSFTGRLVEEAPSSCW